MAETKPKVAVRYLVASQKGGVGKTTTTANLAAVFSLKHKKVLAIDLDPQGCLGESFGIKRTTPKRGIFDLFIFHRPLESLISEIEGTNIHLIPSNINSALMEEMLISATRNRSLLSIELGKIESEYDYIIIDSPPSMSLLTVLGLVTAYRTIIPFQPEPFSLASKNTFLHMMWSVRSSLNPRLGLEGILFTMWDKRLKNAQRLIEQSKQEMGEYILNTIIPRATALANAVDDHLPLVMTDPNSVGSKAYFQLAEELQKRLAAKPDPGLPFMHADQTIGIATSS